MIQHPLLGEVGGRAVSGVTEYLGLKYASLESNFDPPVLYDQQDRGPGPLYCCKFGPDMSGPESCAFDQSLIQHSLPFDSDTKAPVEGSALDSLTLNIAVPDVSNANEPLPVLAYIHGGGLKQGSANWPQNHLSDLVRYSSSIGVPVIGVSINYRTGALGFLTSKEMQSRGYLGNNGLRDQRVALLWIKKNIGGFGGDKDNVTLLGCSAGGASATLQLASEEPLFKRIAPMSGTFLAVRPTSLTAQEGIYWQTAKHLGLDRLSAADRLDALDKIPGLDLVAKMPPFIPFAPVIDGDFCHDRPTFASLAEGLSSRSGQTWCKDICIGDCGFDGSILSQGLAHRKPNFVSEFVSSLKRSLGNHLADPSTILRAYGIQADPNLTAKEEVANDNFIKILTFCQDIVFRAPSITIARQWSTGSAYVYHFNESNPWDGPWKGYASHTLDIAFLSQNFNGHLGLPLQELTKMLGADILRFVHGQASWQDFKAYEKKWTMRVYGPDAKIDLRSEGEIRDAAIWELIDVFGRMTSWMRQRIFLKGNEYYRRVNR